MSCRVKIVLLCQGRGGYAASYKPQRDESQWWSRRDALVRCAAAFFGISNNNQKELVLLFDDDQVRLELTGDLSSNINGEEEEVLVPTEQHLVTLWKLAVTNGRASMGGLTCRVVRGDIQESSDTLPCNMDSKRTVLHHLQTHCPIDFLRQQGLNSSPEVILRKTNKAALLQVWHQWNKTKQRQSHNNKEHSNHSRKNQQQRLQAIYRDLLQPRESGNTRLIAGLLHETADAELPCWDDNDETLSSTTHDDEHVEVCLFLGAVRDMHPWENRCLERTCAELGIPLVRVRLGPVPEFTSKIVTVVAHHHARRRLGPALQRLPLSKEGHSPLDPSHRKRPPEALSSSAPCDGPSNSVLHVLCVVPFDSSALSTHLADRTRAMWCCVRVVVCTLWRSRVASSSVNKDARTVLLENRLTLLFQDGATLTLNQDELTSTMAQQHQAAPCEHQILQALCSRRRTDASSKIQRSVLPNSLQNLIQSVVLGEKDDKTAPISWCAIHLNTNETAGSDGHLLFKLLYSRGATLASTGASAAPERKNLLALLPIRQDISSCCTQTQIKQMRGLQQACQSCGIPVLEQTLVPWSAPDYEAGTITMMQHYIYQGHLFPATSQLIGMPADDLEARTIAKTHKKKKKRKKQST